MRFSEPFRAPPAVQVSIALLDADTDAAIRAELTVETITPEGCEIVFRTWMNTRIARIRVAWMAIGALNHDDDWAIN
ncbi:MAG: H-type lectin domain-containing protein [Pseudodonghicola sp.]|nr:H-type lectin domain-containing protein [Pseudodonghicola sp.]